LAAGLRPDPLGELTVPPDPRCIYERAGNGEGRTGGKDKGGDGRMGEDRRKGREGNERKERGVVPHPKLNPGCATALWWSRLIWHNFVKVAGNYIKFVVQHR